MRHSGSRSGLFKAVIAVSVCVVVIGVVGTCLYSIPERDTVTLTIPGDLGGGYWESSQIRLDGRYSGHISGSVSFQVNVTHMVPLHYVDLSIWTQEALDSQPYDLEQHIPVFSRQSDISMMDETQLNFYIDLPVSQAYYINASQITLSTAPMPEISVVIHYDVSGAKVDFSRTYITVLAGGIFLLLGGGILRRIYR